MGADLTPWPPPLKWEGREVEEQAARRKKRCGDSFWPFFEMFCRLRLYLGFVFFF